MPLGFDTLSYLQSDSARVDDAGGISAISRWLSEARAIPPVRHHPEEGEAVGAGRAAPYRYFTLFPCDCQLWPDGGAVWQFGEHHQEALPEPGEQQEDVGVLCVAAVAGEAGETVCGQAASGAA